MNEKITLQPGKYIIMIDPLWNETILNDDMYREVLLDIYAPESVTIDAVEDAKGMQYLVKIWNLPIPILSSYESYAIKNEDNLIRF